MPLSKLALSELRRALDAPTLDMSFSELRSSDITGKSRACKGLVEAGVELAEARRLTGLV